MHDLFTAEADADKLDIAEANLSFAAGLSGTERIDFAACRRRLDHWTKLIRRGVERARPQYRRNSGKYWKSWAKFRMLVMVTVLQRDLGVRYDLSTLEGDLDYTDAVPWFICGPLTGRGGTCASLPILYLALGRRVGYPLHLVSAREHLFVRWEEPGGERFNIECTSPGFEPRTDEHHRRFPRPLTEADLASGLFLRNMTPHEILAELFAQRGHCLLDHLRIDEALEAYHQARRLVPGHPFHEMSATVATMLGRILHGGSSPVVPNGRFQEAALTIARRELARIRRLHARELPKQTADPPSAPTAERS